MRTRLRLVLAAPGLFAGIAGIAGATRGNAWQRVDAFFAKNLRPEVTSGGR